MKNQNNEITIINENIFSFLANAVKLCEDEFYTHKKYGVVEVIERDINVSYIPYSKFDAEVVE